MAPWKLPFVVVAIVVPIAAGFYVGGPGIGVAVAALVAVGIVVVAVRDRPRGGIGDWPTAATPRRLLVVVSLPLEDAASIGEIATAIGRRPGGAAVLVLAPARIGFLDRWASDLEAARRRAQKNLVLTVASLAKAGVEAEARVGDEDLVQAVEDTMRSFAATEVILVTGGDDEDPAAASSAAELEVRLQPPFRRIAISDSAAR